MSSYPPPETDSNHGGTLVDRVSMSVAGSIFAIAMTLVVALAGYLPMRIALEFCGIVIVLLAALRVLTLAGFNLNRSDPRLTVAFLALAALAISYVVYNAEQAPGAIIAIYLIAFMFGVMTLEPRHLVPLAAFYWVCFMAVIVLRSWHHPETTDLHRSAFGLVVFFMILGWFTAMGVFIDGLRAKVRLAGEKTAAALAELESLARVDALTGCFNRRHAMETLGIEARRAERGHPLSVCLLDLDRFKAINDTYGHAAGDDVLAGLAETVRPLLRATDLLARYGGEEFLLLLSDTPAAEALAACERIRRAVEGMRVPGLPGGVRVTVSIGVAEHDPQDPMARTLQRADQALYAAKGRGRNCVENAAESVAA